MKLVKLSLVAAMAAGTFSALDAKPLEEAIKDVDVSGALRYRFDQASWGKTNTQNGLSSYYGVGENNSPHRFRAFVTPTLSVGDGFKVVGQLMYNNDRNGGWYRHQTDAAGATITSSSGLTTTKNEVVLKQAYLQYDLADAGVSVLYGKQQLGTIWTADFTGMAAKVLITPTQGLTIAAFGVDSFEGSTGDGDAFSFANAFGGSTVTPAMKQALDTQLYNNNMYGAAVLANFAGLDAQVWGAYWDRVATLYAVNLKYTLGLGGGNNVGVKVTYLGNSMDSDLKKNSLDYLDNGNLVDGRVFAKFAGLDAQVGGIFYGKKDKLTINTLEDISGPDLYIGREMFYANNTSLVQSEGQSVFGYVGVGYTLPMDLRIGVQGVFGQNTKNTTNAGVANAKDEKDTRIEGVFELGYKVNKNLSLEGWYSYINSSVKDGQVNTTDGTTSDAKQNKSTVRLQALYKF